MARRRTIAALALVLGAAGVLFLWLGAADLARDTPPAGSAASGRARSDGAASRVRKAQARRRAAVPAAVRELAAGLTRPQQVAQLFLVGFVGTKPTAAFFGDLRARGWGGVVLTEGNFLDPDQLAGLAGEAAVVARDAGRVIPLVASVGVPGFEPPVQSAGAAAAAVREEARAAAARLRAAGLTLAFAPVADVSIEGTDGTFGDDPGHVARLTAAAVAGWRAGGVVAAPGRFPGEGTTSQDPIEGPATIGLGVPELEARDLVPYRAIARRALAVVVSSAAFSAYDPVTPASLTPAIATDLLRKRLRFHGVAVSDDLAGAAAATGGSVGEAAIAALRAGIDLVQVTDAGERDAAYAAVMRAVERGAIPAARLHEALLRVLVLKRAAGLLGETAPG